MFVYYVLEVGANTFQEFVEAVILYVFSQQKWCGRAPRLDETRVGVTKHRKIQ